MDVYGKIQTITSNLLNKLDNPSRLREITDYYGQQTQIADALIKEGKYQEACDVYQGVIDKYGFKTIEEQYYEKHPEKRPEKKVKQDKSSSTSSSVSADSAVEVPETSESASGAAAQ